MVISHKQSFTTLWGVPDLLFCFSDVGVSLKTIEIPRAEILSARASGSALAKANVPPSMCCSSSLCHLAVSVGPLDFYKFLVHVAACQSKVRSSYPSKICLHARVLG